MLEIGTKAPDFTLLDQNGENVSLNDFRGKKVILYFYPIVLLLINVLNKSINFLLFCYLIQN